MPLLETKGVASAQGFGLTLQQTAANYIEDVFSTYLYIGNSTSGGTQTITNSIDLSTKGGLVWIKGRSAASNHILTDTARGAGTTATNNQALSSNLTSAEDLGGSSYDFLSAFNTDGFTVKQGGTSTATRGTNYNAVTYASWTFRKQAKFFDVVTYTGNGSNRTISHSLGSVPGCIIVKRTDTTANWQVYHRANTANPETDYLVLNSTAATADSDTRWNDTLPTSTVFSLGTDTTVNASGGTYVAYLFAHDAGGFGLTGTDNVISCGSFYSVQSGSDVTVNLGFEPQFVLLKNIDAIDDWRLYDSMRGMQVNPGNAMLRSNLANAEFDNTETQCYVTSTGFVWAASTGLGYTGNQIYIAIRRGPMKTPTTGTSVFNTITYTGTSSARTVTGVGFPPDLVLSRGRTNVANQFWFDRLRGRKNYLISTGTGAETTDSGQSLTGFDAMDGYIVGDDQVTAAINFDPRTYAPWNFRRAPGFMDVVCYTGTGSNTTQSHNLGVVPELMIVKRRDVAAAWDSYSSALANTEYIVLNTTAAKATGATRWNSTTPTSTVFSLGTSTTVNASGGTYVAYLFASVSGVSKVGSYTGTGTTKQIDCGFTGGARFVLIKRTDSTGDWYVWDSARGIVSGNDPYLLLNSTAAEVTNTDYVDTYSAGFEISSTAPAAINANGGSFIFLAIA